jgi:vancomycin resistance protein VanJ
VLAVYVALRAAFGQWLWPLTLVDHLLFWPLAACAPLLALALALRRPRAAIALAAGSVLLAVRFGPDLTRRAARDADGTWVTVMTYNIASGLAKADRLLPVLRASGADVIALQEVGRRQAPFLEGELREEYPYRAIHGLDVPGKAILSRHPILESQLFELGSSRPYLRARIDVDGVVLTVVSVHVPIADVALGPFGSARSDIAILARLAADSPPALLAGDFNAVTGSVELAVARDAGLFDAFATAGSGLGFTFPVPFRYRGSPVPPLARIDHVLHTPDMHAVRARLGADGGSDHYPLVVDLARDPRRD